MALTAAERAELASLEKEVGGGGLSKEEQAELASLESEFGNLDAKSVPKRDGGFLENAARVLDYPGGLVRTAGAGLGNLYSLASGSKPIATGDDVVAALKGKAPGSAEYLERAGVTPGPSSDTPFGNISTRDALGFGLDVVTDPLTLIAKGAKGVKGLLLNPAGKATEKAGEAVYKSGFKKIDERLLEEGKKPLSELFLKEGAPIGTTKGLSKRMGEMSKDIGEKRAQAYAKANEISGPIDMSQLSLPRAEKMISKLRASRFSSKRKLADDLAVHLDELKSKPAGLDELSEIKTDLTENLPESAFSGGQVKGSAKKYEKKLAQELRQAIIDQGEKSETGLGKSIDALNEDWSTLLSAKKPTKLQIRRGETPNLFTSIDAPLSVLAPGALPAKKAADLAKTTLARTAAGKGLIKAGESDLIDAIIRRGLINSER